MAGELDNIQLGMWVDIRNAKQNIANFGQEAVKEVNKVNQVMSQTSVTAEGKLTPSLKQNNFQLMNMSRIVQDLPFGFMGIGNNITFMAEQITRAKQEGIGLKAQFSGMLSSLTGVGGIMFAISAIVSLITIFAMKSRESKKNISEINLEMIIAKTEAEKWAAATKKIREDLTKLSELDLANTISRAREQMQLLEKDLAAIEEHEAWGGGFVWLFQELGWMETSEAIKQKLKETDAVIKEGEEIQGGIVDLVQKQEAAVKKIKDEEATTTAQLIDKNRRLQEAERELNRLKNLGVEANKKNTETLIIQYRTAKELIDALQNRSGQSSLRDRYFATRANRDEAAEITQKQIDSILKEDIKALGEENELLGDQVSFWDDIGLSAAQAGRSWIHTMTAGAQILRNNNSMLQQFINLLGQAVIEAFALKAALSILNLFGIGGGPVSAVFGGPVSPASSASPGGGMNKPAFFPGSGNNRTFVNTVVQPVAISGRLVGEGRTLYAIVENEKGLITRFQ